MGAWARTAPSSYAGVWPENVASDGFNLSTPGYGLAVLLAVPLLATALSARRWRGFEPPEILFVPLRGHTLGHAGVAIDGDEGWLLFAGDAYFHHGEMDLDHPHCTPGLHFYQWMLEKDRRARFDNQHRLRELKRTQGSQVTVFSAHDVREFERLAGRPIETPAERMPTGGRNRLRAGWPVRQPG